MSGGPGRPAPSTVSRQIDRRRHMVAEPSERGPTAWTVLLVAATVVLTIGPPIVGVGVFHASDLLLDHPPWSATVPASSAPVNPLLGDTVNNEIPVHAAYRHRVGSGDFPLWLPQPSGGRPLGTITDGGTLGPLGFPYLVVPLWFAPALVKLLEMAVAGGFTFLFLRRLGLSQVASLIGGLVYMTSGFQVVWSNWPQPRVGAWIPALFWALERGMQRRDLAGFLPVPLITAALFLEGFPSVAAYGLLAGAGYVVIRAVSGRRRLGERARSVGLPAACILLGLGLAALQLLPLAERLGELDLGYRVQTPEAHLPPVVAATLAVPNALGSPTDGTYFGPLNYVEVQSFIGVAALLLVAVAAISGHRVTAPRGARGYLWGGTALAALLLYVGGPLLAAFQTVWLFRMNPVGRVRSVLGFFLACLAAIGMESLARRTEEESGRRGVLIGVVGVGLAGAILIGWRLWVHARAAGRVDYVLDQAMIPAISAVIGVSVLAATRRRSFHGLGLAVLVLPALLVLESAAFAVPFLPRVPRQEFYPPTAAHGFLHAHLGGDRFASGDLAMAPGTSTFYGLRSLTSNAFYPPTWAEALSEIDGDAFATSPLFPILDATPEVAGSPIMDRLSVRYFAVRPEAPVFGSVVQPRTSGAGTLVLEPGQVVETSTAAGPIRAVTLQVARPGDSAGARVVAVTVRDANGVDLTSGARRFEAPLPQWLTVPIPEPTVAVRGRVEVSVELRSGAPVSFVTGRDGRPAAWITMADGDELRLAFTEGVLLYERLSALPRIRWAGKANVVVDRDRRLAALGEPVQPDTVILGAPAPFGSGAAARIEVLRDGGDDMAIRVDADGPGYLIVADALQDGWVATVDGRGVALRDAEHAAVAVLLPEGSHRLDLRYDPPSWALGVLLSGASLLLYAAAVLTMMVRGRRRGGARTGRMQRSEDGM
jgi:hypothetical protein